jgi:hypothetical protein
MAKKTVAELEALRSKGMQIASIEEITAKRKARAEKKRQQEEQEKLLRQQKAKEEKILLWYPDFETTKKNLRQLTEKVRNRRKKAVEKGETFVLPKKTRKKILRAYKYLPYLDSQVAKNAKGGLAYNYQIELGDLAIEGLKIQDKVIKVATFKYMDTIFSMIIDWPFLIRMLNKYYVSRYGWALIRIHAKNMPDYAGDLLKHDMDRWADKQAHPETWKKWEQLALKYGGPVDIRELFSCQ